MKRMTVCMWCAVTVIWFILNNYFCNAYLPLSQIDVLQDFYESLNGDKWANCQWNISQLATNKTLPSYYCGLYIDNVTNYTQTVSGITFDGDDNLNGTLPNTIDKLTDLQWMVLWDNELITGSIPNTICNLTKLSHIDFGWVNFYGHIPSCIGNMATIEYIALSLIRSLSMSDEIIKSLCINAKNLYYLALSVVNYTGSIPDCIGNELLQLQHLEITDMYHLISTIPLSFNNLTQLTTISFADLPHLYGTFPSDVLANNDLYFFVLEETSLSGNFPIDTLCEKTNLAILGIDYNPYLSPFIIPDCIQKLKHLISFDISGSSLIYGTVPETICDLQNLVNLLISDTSITGQIPSCIQYNLKKLSYVEVYSNRLSGTFPSITSPDLIVLDIHNNSFEGSISSIFALGQYTNLEIVAVHGNNFIDKHIGLTIKKIFKYSSNIRAITMYNNDYIGGSFPIFNVDINLNKLSLFAAHQLNIAGSIPNNIYLAANVSGRVYWSLYDNQLSGTLPSNLYNTMRCNVTPILLRGNLFTIPLEKDIPEWMNQSQFKNARQLYLTLYDIIKNWIVVIIAVLCYILILVKKQYQLIPDSNIAFIQNIKLIDLYLNNNILLLLLFVLSIFYAFSCSYYSSSPILSYFSLFFFQNENIIINIILLCLFILYNIFTINITIKIIKETLKNNHNLKYSINIKQNKESFEMVSLTKRLITSNELKQNGGKYSYVVLKFIVYAVLLIFSVSMLILYILLESLPNNNVLKITEIYQKLISFSIAFIVAINTSIIIPRFTCSFFEVFRCCKWMKNKNKMIMILRTISTIIIPLIFSFLLLNNCGNGWTKVWKPCLKHQSNVGSSVFNITYILQSDLLNVYNIPPTKLQVLTKSDVCSSLSFNVINWNKCIRTFLFKWSNILIIKFMITFFIPICIIITKTIKNKLMSAKK
eukprot:100385_1